MSHPGQKGFLYFDTVKLLKSLQIIFNRILVFSSREDENRLIQFFLLDSVIIRMSPGFTYTNINYSYS